MPLNSPWTCLPPAERKLAHLCRNKETWHSKLHCVIQGFNCGFSSDTLEQFLIQIFKQAYTFQPSWLLRLTHSLQLSHNSSTAHLILHKSSKGCGQQYSKMNEYWDSVSSKIYIYLFPLFLILLKWRNHNRLPSKNHSYCCIHVGLAPFLAICYQGDSEIHASKSSTLTSTQHEHCFPPRPESHQ